MVVTVSPVEEGGVCNDADDSSRKKSGQLNVEDCSSRRETGDVYSDNYAYFLFYHPPPLFLSLSFLSFGVSGVRPIGRRTFRLYDGKKRSEPRSGPHRS